MDESGRGEEVSYVWETGELMLKTKEALEMNKAVVLSSFDLSRFMTATTPEGQVAE
jgi:hypothetical protein